MGSKGFAAELTTAVNNSAKTNAANTFTGATTFTGASTFSGAVTFSGSAQGAALTVQLTTITFASPGTPDYAVQDLVQNTGFGFVTKDEGNTVLSVIANLQVKMAEIEARLEATGYVASN